MTERPPTVRVAQPRDADALFDFLRLLHEENALAALAEDKVRAMIRRCAAGEGGLIGVVTGPSGIEASVAMMLAQWWYSEDWYLEEVWNFVHPGHRRSAHAKHLIQFGKWVAEQMALPLLMGILTTARTAAKVRLYQRQIPQVGALFLHGVSDHV